MITADEARDYFEKIGSRAIESLDKETGEKWLLTDASVCNLDGMLTVDCRGYVKRVRVYVGMEEADADMDALSISRAYLAQSLSGEADKIRSIIAALRAREVTA